jgi:hypothetical protein
MAAQCLEVSNRRYEEINAFNEERELRIINRHSRERCMERQTLRALEKCIAQRGTQNVLRQIRVFWALAAIHGDS